MNWKIIHSGKNTGKYNMDFDLQLASEVKSDEAYLRFYYWEPYCISLGANQNVNEINSDLAAKNNLDIVKRPTGGRAVLHAEEITYSVITSTANNQLSPKTLYHEINVAIKKGMSLYNPILNDVELENQTPDFRQFYKEQVSAVCFAVPSKSELKYKNRKVVGSAQRKMGNSILQHGSILCGSYHKNIVDYLYLTEPEMEKVKDEVFNKSVDIEEIIKEKVDYNKLEADLLRGFIDQFKITEINYL